MINSKIFLSYLKYTLFSVFLIFGLAFQAAQAGVCEESFIARTSVYGNLESQYREDAEVKGTSIAYLAPSEITSDWVIEKSKELMVKLYWMTPDDREVFYDLLISQRRIDNALKEGKHLSEVFGEDTVRDLKRMTRYLDQIPVGPDFNLTPEMLSEAHRLGNNTQKKFQQKLVKSSFNLLSGYLFKPGVYKKRRNTLHFTDGIPKDAYNNILGKLDELIDLGVFKHVTPENRKHYEMKPGIGPWGPKERDGMMYGRLLYPSPKIVDQALVDITGWITEQARKFHAGDPDAIDPIKVAVVAKQAIVYIHPWVDGNGRISRGIRDKVLEAYGIVPPKRRGFYHDLDLTLEEDTNITKLALARRIRQLQKLRTSDPASALKNFGLRVNKDQAKVYFRVNDQEIEFTYGTRPEKDGDGIVLIGNQRQKEFIFTSSGFFQDYTGVAYTLVPGSLEQRRPRLAPIADKNLQIYGINGESNWIDGIFSRDFNNHHWFRLNDNLKLMAAIKKDPEVARTIELEPYELIESANNKGEYSFHDFEVELVRDSLIIKEDPEVDPLAILMPFRTDTADSSNLTPFEKKARRVQTQNSTGFIPYDDVVGQAQRVDIFYRKLYRHFESNPIGPQTQLILESIVASRKKIHKAVRVLIGNYLVELENLFERDFSEQSHFYNEEVWSILKQKRRNIGNYNLLKNTHFWYDDFDQGVEMTGKDTVAVVRVSSRLRMNNLGLVSEAKMGQFLKLLPGFSEAVKKVVSEFRKNPKENEFDMSKMNTYLEKYLSKRLFADEGFQSKLSSLEREILASPYGARGLEKEFERQFVLMILHWANVAPKAGVSLSTSPGRIFNDKYIQFTSPLNDSAVYVFSVPIDSLNDGFASPFGNEYEVTITEPVFNILNTRPNFILYQSPVYVDEQVKEASVISVAEAQEKGIPLEDFNYIVTEGERALSDRANFELGYYLKRQGVYMNGYPEDLDERHFTIKGMFTP
jgi:hypothetical protein